MVYNAEEEDYFSRGGMGATTVVQHKMDISESKPTSKTSSNKVIIVRIEEVDFCTTFVGGVPGNKICVVTKEDNGSCRKYRTHSYREKGYVESALYLTPNGTNLLLRYLVSLIIGYANQAFISQVGEYLPKDTAMAIMDKVNHTANNSTEIFEEAAYIGTIPTAGMEVIYELTDGEPGSPSKRLKNFATPGMETISDPVIAKFISNLQVHLNHSTEVIVGAQARI